METKTCIKCEIEYPKTLEYFYMRGKYFYSNCKKCHKELDRINYENNNEKIKERKRKYYKNNKETKIKEYLGNNNEKIKESRRKYYENNKEKIKEYLGNKKEEIKKRKRKYYENNIKHIKEYNQEYTYKLSDAYIKNCLLRAKEFVPQEVIETKRLIIKLKRELKTIKN
jgi:hypothetical protein